MKMRLATAVLCTSLPSCSFDLPIETIRAWRTPPPTCDVARLSSLSRTMDHGTIRADEWVRELGAACPEALSPVLVQALERWAGLSIDRAVEEELCTEWRWNTPLITDRNQLMERVFLDCEIGADGLFDSRDFHAAAGPYGGLVASRLFESLIRAQVTGGRAVALAHIVAGMPPRTSRSVYGEHSSKIWGVELVSAEAPRVDIPGCTPTVSLDGETLRWQAREWWSSIGDDEDIFWTDGPGPIAIRNGAELGSWEESREPCEGQGRNVVLALAPELSMVLVRPLLWTLDGLDGYHPSILVRTDDTSAPLTELSSVGILSLRMIDVHAYETGELDSLFAIPSVVTGGRSSPTAESGEFEDPENEAWLPGSRLEVVESEWRFYQHGDRLATVEGGWGPSMNALLEQYRVQLEREGLVLTLSDAHTTADLIAWLERLGSYTDSVLLDARPPRHLPMED